MGGGAGYYPPSPSKNESTTEQRRMVGRHFISQYPCGNLFGTMRFFYHDLAPPKKRNKSEVRIRAFSTTTTTTTKTTTTTVTMTTTTLTPSSLRPIIFCLFDPPFFLIHFDCIPSCWHVLGRSGPQPEAGTSPPPPSLLRAEITLLRP